MPTNAGLTARELEREPSANASRKNFVNPSRVPARLDRIAASTRLNAEVIAFAREANAYLASGREGEAPVRVIRAEAGLGKSTAVLDQLRRELAENPDLRAFYMVPSLDLGDELAEKAKALGIDARVLRGRSQPQPGSTETMCAKAEIAETVAALSLSVSDTLCRRKLEDGTMAECPFAASCAYLRQMKDAKRGGLIIASHQYLAVRMEPLKDIDLLIIDESFWQTLTSRKRIDLGRFLSLRSVGEGFRGKKGEGRKGFTDRQQEADFELGDAVQGFRAIVQQAEDERRGITLADFRARGFTAEHAGFLAGLEYSRIMKPDIHPGQSFEVQKDRLQKATVQEAFAFARVWKILAAELATDRQGEPHGLVVERGVLNPKTGALENVLSLFWSRDPRIKNVPTLVIDADADPAILARFYPSATVAEIAAKWRNVELVQCYDRTGSAQTMKGERRRDEVFNAALDMADRLTETVAGDPSRRPLLVVQKAVEDAFREAGIVPAVGDPNATRHPFDVAHFGALRGRDGWKAAAGIIVAGRIEPSPYDIEAMARGIWFAAPEPLAFLAPDEDGRTMLPKRDEIVQPREGEARAVAVSYHPDERADRVLRQVREAELMQAIARVRPIHRGADVPCQIVVLSNVPLPVEVDRLAAWAEIVPDRFDLARLAGFVPDKSGDMADSFPDLFSSAAVVRKAASRRAARAFGCDISYDGVSIGSVTPQLDWVRVSYERPCQRGNREGGAWVRLAPGDTPATVAARVQAFIGDAFDVDCVLPQPIQPSDLVRAEIARQGVEAEAFRPVSRATLILAGAVEDADDLPWWRLTPPRSNNNVVQRRANL